MYDQNTIQLPKPKLSRTSSNSLSNRRDSDSGGVTFYSGVKFSSNLAQKAENRRKLSKKAVIVSSRPAPTKLTFVKS
jgi:hypothetical protein